MQAADRSVLPHPRKRLLRFVKFCSFPDNRALGLSLLSNQQQEKEELSRDRGINGPVRERPVGLCRESPFTALLSEAIFAVTDDYLTYLPWRVGQALGSRTRAASLLNIMALWDGLQPLKINKISQGVR